MVEAGDHPLLIEVPDIHAVCDTRMFKGSYKIEGSDLSGFLEYTYQSKPYGHQCPNGKAYPLSTQPSPYSRRTYLTARSQATPDDMRTPHALQPHNVYSVVPKPLLYPPFLAYQPYLLSAYPSVVGCD